jgi:2-keto-4-pentenoate hydratase/2-oxohepta-3-ene-1,7-dioic acid hydratase in catechol pathway
MHIATIHDHTHTAAVFVDDERGLLRADALIDGFRGDAMDLIRLDVEQGILERAEAASVRLFTPIGDTVFDAPYHSPHKIWGIGLNYRDHAGDLAENVPDEPASFIKADHTIIGAGQDIVIPRQSSRVTAEAELGLIIGREAREVSEASALDHVWGVCTVLDQTAEDILRRNPRFLTRSKNFPSFFSFGPRLVPLAEALAAHGGQISRIGVTTALNSSETRTNTVENMTFGPEFLVSFHSQMMPLYTGDIISSGTPGALVIADGDVAECRIPGVGTLTNPVRAEIAK